MKIRLGRSAIVISALVILLILATTPSFADTELYTNGPINGTVNGYWVSQGYSVADSFTLTGASTINSGSLFGIMGRSRLRTGGN